MAGAGVQASLQGSCGCQVSKLCSGMGVELAVELLPGREEGYRGEGEEACLAFY